MLCEVVTKLFRNNNNNCNNNYLDKQVQNMGAGNEPMKLGYRIISVDPGSPVSVHPVEPMLDFIVYPTEKETLSFEDFLVKNENQPITLTLYNIVTRKIREIVITPHKWEGKGLLGTTIRLEDYAMAHTRVLRVLNFYVDSPLHKAGFKAKKDYILGDDKTGFKTIDDFSQFITEHDKKPIDLFVYNSDEGKVRKVTLVPDKDWGGSGLLGGDIGFGELHELPVQGAPEEEEKATAPPTEEKVELPLKGRRKSTEEEAAAVAESEILIGQKGETVVEVPKVEEEKAKPSAEPEKAESEYKEPQVKPADYPLPLAYK